MTPPHSSDGKVLSLGLVSPGWPANAMPNGIVSYTATLVRELLHEGMRCHVFAPPAPAASPAHPDFVHCFAPRGGTLTSKVMWRLDPSGWQRRCACAALLGEVNRLHAREPLDILELEESFGWADRLAGRIGVPLVVRLHGPWFLNGPANRVPQDRQFHRRDLWERCGLAAADAVTAPSRHVLDQTRAHFGLDLTHAHVIANPVEPVDSENRWKLETCDHQRIAFIGRFDRHKGGDTVLDALRLILQRNPAARLDFVGPDRGYIDPAGHTWKIEQYLQAKLGPIEREKVTYHGFQPGPAAAQMRKRALVTVAPSRYETFGIAAAEAMMAGCPLVVCGAGALTELVQHDHNGLVARPGDAGDLAASVLSLQANPSRAALLGKHAAEDASRRYSPHVVAGQTVAFYREVLARTAGAGRTTMKSSYAR